MSEDAKCQGIIAALVVALIITGSFYWKARGELSDAEQEIRRLFNKLPASEQQQLLEDQRIRFEMLDGNRDQH